MDLKKKTEEIFEISAQSTANVVSSMFLEGIAGSLVPGVMSVVLSYKQKRSERMIEKFMIETRIRQDEFENKLLDLEEKDVKDIREKYFGLVLDYVIETKQEEKITYIVNGFINLTEMERLQEDVVLIFYDVLDELNILDIRVLKLYDYFNRTENYLDILETVEITSEQYDLIRNKLERLELIQSRAHSQYEDLFINVINIGDYLTKISKGKKAYLKFKKPGLANVNSFELTKFGRRFLNFFNE